MRQFRVFFLEPKRRPAVESFQTAFQIDPQVFQKRLEQYMTGQLTLPAIEYTLKDRIIVDSQSKPRTLPDAEVQFYLGDLLLHSGRLPEAEPYLKKAIALDPTFAPPQASLGMLRLRQGDRAEALDYLKKAADSDSKSHLVHYYYAQLLSQTAGPQRPNDDQLATMRTELKKTVALSPNFLPAVDLLAYVNLLRNDDLAESATLLRAALMVSPGRDNLSMRLVEVLFRTHEWDEARSLIQTRLSQ